MLGKIFIKDIMDDKLGKQMEDYKNGINRRSGSFILTEEEYDAVLKKGIIQGQKKFLDNNKDYINKLKDINGEVFYEETGSIDNETDSNNNDSGSEGSGSEG